MPILHASHWAPGSVHHARSGKTFCKDRPTEGIVGIRVNQQPYVLTMKGVQDSDSDYISSSHTRLIRCLTLI